MAIGAHARPNGGWDEWLTPPHILAALGSFDLDPCAPVVRPWPTAATHYTIESNGLAQPWSGRVWLNPPYGKEAEKWLSRMAQHGDGVALLFARTETRMFFEYIWPVADATLFLEGRLHFHHVDGRRAEANSGGPSVLIAYGARNMVALMNSGLPGKYVDLQRARTAQMGMELTA